MWKDDAFRFAFLLNQESPLAFGMEKLAQPHSSSFFQAQQGVTDAVTMKVAYHRRLFLDGKLRQAKLPAVGVLLTQVSQSSAQNQKLGRL